MTILDNQLRPADSEQLFISLLKTADIAEDKQSALLSKFEGAVYARTLQTLLDLLPTEQRQKLKTTMHFQPDRFLNRILAILQAFATTEQIVEVMDKTGEETFLEFFDTFLTELNEEQKLRVDAYLTEVGRVVGSGQVGRGV